MNYNEYNKKDRGFNFNDVVNDKKQRARVILLGYAVLFIILVVMIRVSGTNSQKTTTNLKENIPVEEKEKDYVDEMFSYIDQNNYDFKITAVYNEIISVIEGKRYNDKYYFTLTTGENVSYFLGNENNMKGKPTEDDEYIPVEFPYAYLNYFDNEVLKEIIRNSSLVNGEYEITNELFNNVIDKGSTISLDNKDEKNTIELLTRNNQLVSIVLEYTNVISDYMNENIIAKVTIEYSNFGLVEDFEISFE